MSELVKDKTCAKKIRLPLIILLGAGLLVLIWFFFLRAPSENGNNLPAGQAFKVPVLIADPTDLTISVQLSGRLEAYRQAEVMARVPGIVLERTYKEGQEVKEGAVLFKIDPASYQADLDIAEANLARAKAAQDAATDKVARQKSLVADRAVSERDYTESLAQEKSTKADVLYAQAQVKKARLQLDYATVTAPIAGRARKAMVTEGALVGQTGATHLTTIDQMDPIYVNFAQSAAEVMTMQKAVRQGSLQDTGGEGAEVELLLPDGSIYAHNGELIFSDLSVDPGTDSVVMRAAFANPERVLLPGAYVSIKLKSAMNRHVFLVPRDALTRTQQTALLMVLDGDGVVQARPVVSDILRDKNWVVTQGLQDGDRIIVGALSLLKPGMKAEAMEMGKTPQSIEAAGAVPADTPEGKPGSTPDSKPGSGQGANSQ